INHWIQCTPGTGSLVTLTQGSVSCRVVKVVPNRCTTAAPSHLYRFATGPALTSAYYFQFYYFFDGSPGQNWPVHDPCGVTSANQLTGVENPGGAIYVR